jgi:TonB-dependent receptor
VSGGGISVPNMLFGNFDQILSATGITFPTLGQDPSQFWRVRENDFEGYVKGDFAGNIGSIPFYGNAGVRLVDVTSASYAYANQTVTSGGVTTSTGWLPTYASQSYFKALPSLNLNFDLTDTFKLRAGVARVMSRPPLDELRASQNLAQNSPTQAALNSGTAGNPYLKPFMATQADLSLEWYFHKDALFAVSGYYKKVSNNIGYATTTQTIGGVPYQITSPQNGPGGHVAGAEFTLQTPFYFIGLEHFGLYSNVSLVTSNLKEMAPVSNPFDAVGLTKFTGEFDLWYSDHGIDARVALKHHSPYTVIYGWDASQLTRLQSETTLGASISYALTKNVSVRLQANNLTNQVARFYYNNDPNQIARYERYGRNYLMDVTFKY